MKCFIEERLPGVLVTISCPILRCDDMKANLTLRHLRGKIKRTNVNAVYNENINQEDLGKQGLHLSGRDSGRLAVNFISLI